MSQPFLYSVEREYPVPVDELWSAWTNTSKLEEWYHPLDMACVRGATVSELQVGGTWAVGIDVIAHNFAVYFYGTYSVIEPLRKFEHSMHYTESADEFVLKDMSTLSHLIVIEFEDRGTQSWVKFSQFGELPEGQTERAQAGMESYFDSLQSFLSR